MDFIIKNVKCSVIFVDGADKIVKTLVKLFESLGADNPVKTVIFSNNISAESLATAKQLGVRVLTCDQLKALGDQDTTDPESLIATSADLEKIAVIM